MAHDVDGAKCAWFLTLFKERGDEGDAHIFDKVAAISFSDRSKLGVKNQSGLIDSLGLEGLADAGSSSFAAQIGSGAEVLRKDAPLDGDGLIGISCIALERGRGLLVENFGIGIACEGLRSLLMETKAFRNGCS